jgi:hypothetical protein
MPSRSTCCQYGESLNVPQISSRLGRRSSTGCQRARITESSAPGPDERPRCAAISTRSRVHSSGDLLVVLLTTQPHCPDAGLVPPASWVNNEHPQRLPARNINQYRFARVTAEGRLGVRDVVAKAFQRKGPLPADHFHRTTPMAALAEERPHPEHTIRPLSAMNPLRKPAP